MIDPLVPAHIEGVVPYQPGKPIEELERELGIKGAIKLSSNENPLGVSPRALKAATDALRGVNRYPDGGGFALRAKIARKYGVTSDEIVLGNGSVDLIDLIVRTFVGPQEEGLIAEHSFLSYSWSFKVADRAFQEIPRKDYRYDLEAMARAITPRTKVIFLANPDNPTGTYVTREELDAFVKKLPSRVILVLDEAYREFVRAEDCPDGLSYRDRVPRLILLRTFAKAHGLAGLRIGYAICSPGEIASYLNRTRLPFNANLVAQSAALAALDDDDFVQRSRQYAAEALATLEEGLRRLEIGFLPSQTNFLFVDVGRDTTEVFQALLREGVIVRPLKAYGYPQHLRISIGLPEENQRLLGALAKVLGKG